MKHEDTQIGRQTGNHNRKSATDQPDKNYRTERQNRAGQDRARQDGMRRDGRRWEEMGQVRADTQKEREADRQAGGGNQGERGETMFPAYRGVSEGEGTLTKIGVPGVCLGVTPLFCNHFRCPFRCSKCSFRCHTFVL